MSKESSIKVFAENASGTRPANAIPVWIDNISAIGGGGGGGSDFDPTYMSAQIDNKLNKSEVGFRKVNSIDYVSAISGKTISARFAAIANTAYNADRANTASYDDNGNSLTTTYYNAQEANNKVSDLFNFVQTNSANWEGGSAPASDTVLFHKSTYQPAYGGKGSTDSYIANASDLYFEASVYSNFGAPNSIIIEQNGSIVGEAYWTQVSSDGDYNYYSASFNGQPNSDYRLNNNGYDSYNWCYVSANGVRTEAFNQEHYKCTTNDTVKINVQGSNITGTIFGINQGMNTPLTSVNGSLTDFTAKGYEQYNCDIYAEVYDNDCSYSLSAEFEGGGSTVASSDVFPPTNNLDPYSTYYLGWNANNGGLFWYNPGNGGN